LKTAGSQILFNLVFSENIQSQTEKSQNSLMLALHHFTFTVRRGTNLGPAFVEVYIDQVFAFHCENAEVCFL